MITLDIAGDENDDWLKKAMPELADEDIAASLALIQSQKDNDKSNSENDNPS